MSDLIIYGDLKQYFSPMNLEPILRIFTQISNLSTPTVLGVPNHLPLLIPEINAVNFYSKTINIKEDDFWNLLELYQLKIKESYTPRN